MMKLIRVTAALFFTTMFVFGVAAAADQGGTIMGVFVAGSGGISFLLWKGLIR